VNPSCCDFAHNLNDCTWLVPHVLQSGIDQKKNMSVQPLMEGRMHVVQEGVQGVSRCRVLSRDQWVKLSVGSRLRRFLLKLGVIEAMRQV
jgi:hypothetical protein